jgi:hypothetical protein
MSQEIKMVLGSCGLIVGLNIAPPPPGPMTRNPPGRSAKAAVKQAITTMAGSKRRFIGFQLTAASSGRGRTAHVIARDSETPRVTFLIVTSRRVNL